MKLFFMNEALFSGFTTQKNIGSQVEVGSKVELLMDQGYAQIHRFPDIFKINLLPINKVITRIRRLNTGQNFH